MNVIEVLSLSKDYGNQKGIFDISFTIQEGETVAFLGPNGSGKTSTIRHLMGFVHGDQGSVKIFSQDCFKQADQLQSQIGYLPGEINLMNEMTAMAFIELMAKMKNVKDMSKVYELVNYFELDTRGKMKRMSKGMKQKIGLVVALMNEAPLLILDEPTSGLDPLMQNKFMTLIHQLKKEGKTIFMSSHIFEEIENTCDRVIMIKDGHIIDDQSIQSMKHNHYKNIEITFSSLSEAHHFQQLFPNAIQNNHQVSLTYHQDINTLIQQLTHYHILDISMKSQSLEELFLHYYGGSTQ